MTAQTSGEVLNLKSSLPVVSSSASCTFGSATIYLPSVPLRLFDIVLLPVLLRLRETFSFFQHSLSCQLPDTKVDEMEGWRWRGLEEHRPFQSQMLCNEDRVLFTLKYITTR